MDHQSNPHPSNAPADASRDASDDEKILALVPDSACAEAGGHCLCGVMRTGCTRGFYRMNRRLIERDLRAAGES